MAKEIIEWCDRSAAAPLPFYGLCLSEAAFLNTLKRLGEKYSAHWVTPGSNGTMHTLHDKNGQVCCIVCIDGTKGTPRGHIYGLLIHESVHIWQKYCLSIGEKEPSSEFEAYTIQHIAQNLITSFDRAIMEKKL